MRVPQIRTDLPGPRAAEIIAEQEQLLSPSCTRDFPLVARRGSGCWLEDVDGNEFLDFSAGIAVCSTGHCHPRVVAAATAQTEMLIHMSGTDFYYEPQGDLARRLTQLCPVAGPQRVFFTNSGAESIEAAIKLARFATRRSHLLAFTGAFHGRTLGALALTNSKRVQRRGFSPLLPEVSHLPYPGRQGVTVEDTFRALDDLLRRKIAPDEIAAVFVEPIQGEGGYVIPPADFLPRLRGFCDEHEILFVADEVQSGMGRTGRFCALEHWNVQADIVCLAKGIASGFPLGAMVARADLMKWPPGSHGTTFGGNPVACIAGLATINLVEEELMKNAEVQGQTLLTALRELQRVSPLVANARGLGLMVAIDFPNPKVRNEVLNLCFRQGLILLGTGDQSIRFCPPLVVTTEEIQVAVDILRTALVQMENHPLSAAG